MIPGPAQWVKGSGIAAAEAHTQSLAQELLYATSAPIKKKIFFFLKEKTYRIPGHTKHQDLMKNWDKDLKYQQEAK